MQTFDVLSPTLSLKGRHFIEASAGTGKTFAIEHFVVRLLLEEEIKISEILLMTFTRAATRDLKGRILSNLQRVLRDLSQGASSLSYLEPHLDDPLAKRKIEEACSCFEEAQVFTIHGFCARMLAEFPLQAHASFSAIDPDDQSYKGLMRRIVVSYMRSKLKAPTYSPNEVALLGEPMKLIESVVKLMESSKQLSRPSTLAQLQGKFSEHQSFYPELSTDYANLSSCFKRMTDPTFPLQVERLASGKAHLEDFLLEKSCFLSLMHVENKKVRCTLPELGIFEHMRKRLLPLIEEAKDPKRILKCIAYDCKKSLGGHLLPDELLLQMEEACKKPGFASLVQQKYRAVIIDEFQDTDPVQWSLIEKLFLDAPLLTFCLVGDPKQSIYAFRGADIYTYLHAQETVGRGHVRSLSTNYRSAPSLLRALNHLFSQAGSWIELPQANKSLFVPKVEIGRGEEKSLLDDGKRAMHLLFAKNEEELFSSINDELCGLLGKGYTIAILIKDRYQGRRLQSYLRSLGISASFTRGYSLIPSPAFDALEQLIDAARHPRNIGKLRLVLAGPLASYSHFDLKEPLEKELVGFQQLHHTLAEKGSNALLQQFLQMQWGCCPSPEMVRDLNALLDLPELHQLHPDDERLKPPPPSLEEELVLLTTHASKGLEFDIVFALGLAFGKPSEGAEEEAEKMRQLYVGLTRAKERLYIPLLFTKEDSPLERFFSRMNIHDEMAAKAFISDFASYSSAEKKPAARWQPPSSFSIPSTFSPILQHRKILSFSSLAPPSSFEESVPLSQEVKNAHTLPRGSATGLLLHSLLEEVIKRPPASLKTHVYEKLKATSLASWEEVVFDLIEGALQFLQGAQSTFPEMEFLQTHPDGYLKGFIDLVFEKDKKLFLVDWKSNWLGPSDAYYTEEHLKKALLEHHYDLQAEIYSSAIKRYLSYFPTYSYGGAYYFFLRGRKFLWIS